MATTRQRIRLRRDTQANWAAQNPVLLSGEIGYESDTKRAKIGDGVSTWSALEYAPWNSHPVFDLIGLRLDANETPTEGQLTWSIDEGTVQLGQSGGTVNHLGQDLQLLARNNSNTTAIPKGTGVMFAGTLGASGRLKVAPMVANGTQPGYVFLGITEQTIAAASDGYVTVFGKIRGINTSTYSDGAVLWCSPTTPGGFTTTEPQAPNLKLAVAAVVRAANNGTIMVRWTVGSRLSDLHDVEASGPKTNGDVLTYVSANSRWEPKPVASNSLSNLLDVDASAKVDKSVLVYDQALGKWVGSSVYTTLTLTDGGNF